MRIRVISCSEPTHWHADKIGEEFKVETEFGYLPYYAVKCEDNKYALIPKTDCEIIIPSNKGKAIGMLALTEDIYEKKIELVEKLLNDIDSLQQKLDFFNAKYQST